MKVKAKFKKVHPDSIIPSFKKDRDSGFDLHATHDGVVKFGEVTVVNTGLKLELTKDVFIYPSKFLDNFEEFYKNPWYNITLELQVRPRSGLALNEGITVVNSPGTVDNGFRGEIKVILSRLKEGEYHFKKGDRIAQGVVVPVFTNVSLDIEETNELSESDRGADGYGSTGKQ
jgi:dUTP pyrophosphatase